MHHLISGGARSGKSRFAQQLAQQWQENTGGSVKVIATAEAGDHQMAERIAHHRAQRPKQWHTIECARGLGDALKEHSTTDTLLLVDCLTLWLANELFPSQEHLAANWLSAKQALLECLNALPGPVILIGNEVGQGVVPLGEGNRRFIDEMGWLHQAIAEQANRVTLMVAGLPVELKGHG